MKTGTWNGPNDIMIPNVGVGMRGEELTMDDGRAEMYKDMGLFTPNDLDPPKRKTAKLKEAN